MKYLKIIFGIFILMGFFISAITTASYANAQETIQIESEHQNKFDVGFYDEIQQKINLKNTLTSCFDNNLNMSFITSQILVTNPNINQQCRDNIPQDQQILSELINNTSYHNVVIIVYSDVNNTSAKNLTSDQNKDILVHNLQDVGDDENIIQDMILPFASAYVPVTDMSKFAGYIHFYEQNNFFYDYEMTLSELGIVYPPPEDHLGFAYTRGPIIGPYVDLWRPYIDTPWPMFIPGYLIMFVGIALAIKRRNNS